MKALEELLEQLEFDIEEIKKEIQKKVLFKEELKKQFLAEIQLASKNKEEMPIFKEN